jgi:hypothetical protein
VVVRVAQRDGDLYVSTGDESHPARPYAEAAFFVEAQDEPLRFLENDRGEVWAAFMSMRTMRKAE